MLARMRQPATRARALLHIRERLRGYGDPLLGYTASGAHCGVTLSAAAEAAQQSPAEMAYDLILSEEGCEAAILPWGVPPSHADAIIERTVRHPRWMAASDGVYNIPHPHPRGYGCFARIIRRFVRESGLLPIEEAVFRLSGFPARRFGLADRGRIAAGMAADVVVMDVDSLSDRATWNDPRRPAVGMRWVLVNGEPVIARGTPTGALPGKVVSRSTHSE
jgi:N-acyl-D-amino-acid deacylase